MSNLIKIISKGGSAQGTVVTQDGVELKGIRKIEIEPLEPSGEVIARLEFIAELDIEALVAAVGGAG